MARRAGHRDVDAGGPLLALRAARPRAREPGGLLTAVTGRAPRGPARRAYRPVPPTASMDHLLPLYVREAGGLRRLRPGRDRDRPADQRPPRAVPQPDPDRDARHPGQPVDGRRAGSVAAARVRRSRSGRTSCCAGRRPWFIALVAIVAGSWLGTLGGSAGLPRGPVAVGIAGARWPALAPPAHRRRPAAAPSRRLRPLVRGRQHRVRDWAGSTSSAAARSRSGTARSSAIEG